MAPHGFILTHVYALEQLEAMLREAGATLLKVIGGPGSGWGPPGGWTTENVQRVARMVPNLIIRTMGGDPSYGEGTSLHGSKQFLNPDEVEREVAPWLALKPDAYVELGNEPNIYACDTDFIWRYRYWLRETTLRLRARFPRAKLISPALLLSGSNTRQEEAWLTILHQKEAGESLSPLERLDFLGVHLYEHYGFVAPAEPRLPATTGQILQARRLMLDKAPRKPWCVTEFGVNDPHTSPLRKGWHYGNLIRRASVMIPSITVAAWSAYHICADERIHPQYAASRLMMVGYRQGLAGREAAYG